MGDAETTQTDRLLTIEVEGMSENALLVSSLMGQEAISSLFYFTLELLSERPEEVTTETVFGRKVTIQLRLRDDTSRFFNGFVSRFALRGTDERFTQYQFQVVPWTWFLSKRTDCRIFQDKTVPEIIEEVFSEINVSDFRSDLTRSYTKWDYCVQYRETDLQFISRLMEQEGIFYFFEHQRGRHTLVLADAPQAHQPCPGQPTVRFLAESGFGEREDTISSWEGQAEVRSGACALRDYHFEMPSKTLEVTEPSKFEMGNEGLEIYDYPGEYAQLFNKPEQRLDEVEPEGRKIVAIRMEEEETPLQIAYGASTCRAFMAGARFEMVDPPPGSDEGPYVLTSVQHSAIQSSAFVSGGAEGGGSYYNNFTCIPGDVPFRPARTTHKPVMRGPQTAKVVGPSGEEIFVDKYGRVKVQFHWDRQGQNNADSSCWVRVSTLWAGTQWGMIHIPRIGQEVVVDFLEGDPDQPIIVGSVYNAEMMPPYTLPDNKTQSGIKSRSSKDGGPTNFNEIRFEDKSGEEQVYIHAERNLDTVVEADETRQVGHDRQTRIGNDDTLNVENDHIVYIDGEELITISGQQKLGIGRRRSTSVGGSDELEVTGRIRVEGRSGIAIICRGSFSIESTGPVTLTAPSVQVDAATITFNAAMVQVAGVVQCQTLITTSVVSPTYTPGAGNIW